VQVIIRPGSSRILGSIRISGLERGSVPRRRAIRTQPRGFNPISANLNARPFDGRTAERLLSRKDGAIVAWHEPNRQPRPERTATMNTSSDSTKRTLRVHIVDVVKQKEGGYTLVVQPHSDSEINSDEIWRVALPGDFRGATRVDRLWHLYYGEDPGYSPGAWLDLAIPDHLGDDEGPIKRNRADS
jgi:hypothetical protein